MIKKAKGEKLTRKPTPKKTATKKPSGTQAVKIYEKVDRHLARNGIEIRSTVDSKGNFKQEHIDTQTKKAFRVYKSDIHEMGWKSVDEMVKAKNYKERK